MKQHETQQEHPSFLNSAQTPNLNAKHTQVSIPNIQTQIPNIILLKRTARQVLTLVVCNSLRWYAELNHPEPK